MNRASVVAEAAHDTQNPVPPFVPVFAGLVSNGFATVSVSCIDLYGFQPAREIKPYFVLLAKINKWPFIEVMHNPVVTLAFVLLNCDIGAEKSVLVDMRSITGVSEAMGVSGIYDIVARLRADSNDGITNILRKFHRISHVRSCSTMIVAEELNNWQSK